METCGNIGNNAQGNTIPARIVPSRYWCFTLNNYTDEEVEQLMDGNFGNIVFGYEKGENGTPHLQGYIEFEKKTRPSETIKNKRIHWEKRKGSREEAFNYCIKDCNKDEDNFYQKGFDDMYDFE